MKFIEKEKHGDLRILKILNRKFEYDRNTFRFSKIAFSAKIKNAKLKGANAIRENVIIKADKTSSIIIEKGADIDAGCEILALNNSNIIIGKNCRIGMGARIIARCANINIGDHALFAPSVTVRTEKHGYEDIGIPVMYQANTYGDINIGSGGWIGEKTIILKDVNIGDHVVIGAGSIVTKSVPDYSVAAGSPCKVIKKYNFDTNMWEKII